mgnify:FL=1
MNNSLTLRSQAPVTTADLTDFHAEILKRYEDVDPYIELGESEYEEALGGLGLYLLFESNPDPGWLLKAAKRKNVLTKLPVISNVNLICQTTDCPYYSVCPVMRQIPDLADRHKLKGTECRADRIYGLELIVGLIKELDVRPEKLNELIMVAEMGRLLVLKRRIDWHMALDGTEISTPHLVAQKTGTVYYRLEAHPLLSPSFNLDKQLESLRKQMLANRKEQAVANQQETRAQSLVSHLMSRMQKTKTESIDAEYIEDLTNVL